MFQPLASGLIYTLSGRRVTDASPTNLGECMGIEQCKIYDSNGKLKKVISAEEGSKRYWSNYTKENDSFRKLGSKPEPTQFLCKECNKLFTSTVKRGYCYTPCTDPKADVVRADIPMKPRICENYKCKKTFKPNRSRQIFCNDPCTSHPSILKTPKSRKCKQCQKVFLVEGKTKYCNNPCTRYTAYGLKNKRI